MRKSPRERFNVKFTEPGPGPADGFEHVSRPVARIVDQVAAAMIRRAVVVGDADKAARLRRMMRNFSGGANAG